MNNDRKSLILGWVEKGETSAFMGRELGISRERVRQLLQQYGIPPRGPKRTYTFSKVCHREACGKTFYINEQIPYLQNRKYCSVICRRLKDPRSFLQNGNVYHPFCRYCKKAKEDVGRLMKSSKRKTHTYICRGCNADKAKIYRNTEKGAKIMYEKNKRIRKKHPEKTRARTYLNTYLKRGKIQKQPCACGETKVDAHHSDYSKPLDVIWLCRQHHADLHMKLKKKTVMSP